MKLFNVFGPQLNALRHQRTTLLIFSTKERIEIQQMAKAVNRLRNRVAHHEPLLDLNVPDAQSHINQLVALRCAETAAWMRHHTTVATVMRSRPKKNGSAPSDLASRMSPDFITVAKDTSLLAVLDGLDRKRQTAVCVDDHGLPIAALTALDVTRFISAEVKRNDGLFEPGEKSVGDLLDHVDAAARSVLLPSNAALTTAISRLQDPNTDVLIGTDPVACQPIGTIQRAHRPY